MKRSIVLPVIFSFGLLCSNFNKVEASCNLNAIVIPTLTFFGASGLVGAVLNQVKEDSFESKVITVAGLMAALYAAKHAYDVTKK